MWIILKLPISSGRYTCSTQRNSVQRLVATAGSAAIWITAGHRTFSDQFKQLMGKYAHARIRCLRSRYS